MAPTPTTWLGSQPAPLYAVLDAARDDAVLGLLHAQSAGAFESLYQEDPARAELAPFAPYLVRLHRSGAFLDALLAAGWSRSWGIFLTTEAPFAEVRHHLRRFLLVRDADDRELYFRFYDPRVLRVFLPTCDAPQAAAFFGPVQAFLTETATGGRGLTFTRSLLGEVRVAETALAPDATITPAG